MIALLLLASIRLGVDNVPADRLLVYPRSGVPAFVQPGGTLEVLVRYPVKEMRLVPKKECNHCTTGAPQCSPMRDRGMMRCKISIPRWCDSGTYDLYVKFINNINKLEPLSVRVAHRGDLRLLLTADHQLEDPTWRQGTRRTPGRHDNIAITRQEMHEFGLIDPDVAIHLGDLTFGSDPARELRQAMNLWAKRSFAMNFLPGNHDGYAIYDVRLPSLSELSRATLRCGLPSLSLKSTNDLVKLFAFLSCAMEDLKQRLFDNLRIDSLVLWRSEVGPMDRSFTLGRFCFILLNTYSGSAERRHSFVLPLDAWKITSSLPEGVPLVDNYGGELTDAQLGWVESEMSRCAREGKTILVFGHQDPRGNLRGTRYHRDDPFPTDPVSASHFEEWNYDPKREKPAQNSGTRLVRLLARYGGWYFSGHVHYDAMYSYAPGDEIVPGVKAEKRVTFVKVTTGASMTRKGAWWGYSLVMLGGDGSVNLAMTPDGRPVIPAGGFGLDHGKVWSFLPFPVPLRIQECLPLVPEGYLTGGWGRLASCPGPWSRTGSYVWEGQTPISKKPYKIKELRDFSPKRATGNPGPKFTILADGHTTDSTTLSGVRVLEATQVMDRDGVYEARWVLEEGQEKNESPGTSVRIPRGFTGSVTFMVRDGRCAWSVWKGRITRDRTGVLGVPGCSCVQGCAFGFAETSLVLLLLLVAGVLLLRKSRNPS